MAFQGSCRFTWTPVSIPEGGMGFNGGRQIALSVKRGAMVRSVGVTFRPLSTKSSGLGKRVEKLTSSIVCFEQSRKGIHSVRFSGETVTDEKDTEYVGPVEIRRVGYAGGQRGLYATEPISAYTTVIVSNAMASGSNFKDIRTQLKQRAASSKRSKAQIYSLLSARGKAREKAGEVPPMELFQPGSEWAPPHEGTRDLWFQMEMIKRNAFGIEGGQAGYGIWGLPSFMNHSCVPNCNCIIKGRVMYIYSLRDIRPDEELTQSYFSIRLFSGLDIRQDETSKQSFTCGCERCLLEDQLYSELSSIRFDVDAAVPDSKQEFAHSVSEHWEGIKTFVNPYWRSSPALEIYAGIHVVPRGHQQTCSPACCEDPKSNFGATKRLASLADRLESLIGSLDKNPDQQSWIRASFLEAYLAKYMLATVSEPNSWASIGMLDAIVKTMMSIRCNEATLILGQKLFHEVRRKCNENSEICKSTKDLVLQMMRARYLNDEETAQYWHLLMAPGQKPLFHYSMFNFVF